ncbi:hypothetical protein [Pseudomonas aeruginosa]|uniref:hypothetical protein n=2 Tax=Pseudomonas aeruginosa TaxID=287 RepID=UPI0011613FFC|nr:hypothetical protein [Pseudomonas aeruginosa]MBT9112202.1 hypothetical protein [Pseudomonas aeruginosa]
MRANPIAAAALAALMNIHAVAADATSTTNPTMTSRTAIKGTGCARNYEEAFTTAGTPPDLPEWGMALGWPEWVG